MPMKSAHILTLLLVLMMACSCQKTERQTPHALYEQAVAAYENDSLQESERLCQLAIRQAKAENDLHTMYLAQLQLAQSLSWGNAKGALDMAKQALHTYEQKPDNERNLIIILDYISTFASQCAYNNDSGFDEALHYAQKANEMAMEAKDTTLICQTLTSLANIHWAMEEYVQALTYARKAVRLAPPTLLFSAQQVLARTMVSCDSLSEAEAIYRSMDYANNIQGAYIVESNLAKLALNNKNIEAASEAIDEAFGRAEDLYFRALGEKDAYYQATLWQEQENERIRYRQRLHVVLIICGLGLIVLLTFAVVREVRLRRRERQIHEHENAVQREQLRQRDATVDFLKNFIYQRSEVVQKLSASGDRYISISKGEWSEVERMLNAIDGNRFARLREQHSELKEEDVQLCILTSLRLTNRTIGNVYAISISAVQHRKLKLKKDVFGETDPETTLEQVLDAI